MVSVIRALSLLVSVAAVFGQQSIDIFDRYEQLGLDGYANQTADDAWIIGASGRDIWNDNDRFHFLYWNKTGDVTVTLLAKTLTNTHSWAKAGPMIRASPDSPSANGMLSLTGAGRRAFQWRSERGRWSASHNNWHSDGYNDYESETWAENPKYIWLRLVKEGSLITSYVKDVDEYGFRQFGPSQDIAFEDDEFHVGVAVTSHDRTLITKFDTEGIEIVDEALNVPAVTDIGPVRYAAQVQETAQDVWELEGSGTIIGGTADNFAFQSSVETGDVSVTMYLDNLERRDNLSSGGLMIRASAEPGSPHVSLLVVSSGGVTMMYRPTAGAETVSRCIGVHKSELDLKIAKEGNTFSLFYRQAESGADWYHVDSVDVDLGEDFLVGRAVASNDLVYWPYRSKLVTGPIEVDYPPTMAPTPPPVVSTSSSVMATQPPATTTIAATTTEEAVDTTIAATTSYMTDFSRSDNGVTLSGDVFTFGSSSSSADQFGMIMSNKAFVGDDVDFKIEYTQSEFLEQGGYQSSIVVFFATDETPMSALNKADNDYAQFEDSTTGWANARVFNDLPNTWFAADVDSDSSTRSSASTSTKFLKLELRLRRNLNQILAFYKDPLAIGWTQIGPALNLAADLHDVPIKFGVRIKKEWKALHEFDVKVTKIAGEEADRSAATDTTTASTVATNARALVGLGLSV
mmetsp:Transcript_32342/g.72633  ORF Transcript_32342/g.72633 Transcript_32342/m.72633 type:complete len:687 (-) Transcript_32342:475-2535(-)